MADDSLDCVANNLQFGSTNQTRLEIASSQSVKTPQGARDRTNPNELNWNEKKKQNSVETTSKEPGNTQPPQL